MQVSDFDFSLPPELIAQQPLENRTASRLLCLDRNSGAINHHHFTALLDYLQPGDLLVLNDTRVIPARLRGCKMSGGKVELLVERILDQHTVLAHIKASSAPKPGTQLIIADTVKAEVIDRQHDLFIVKFYADMPLLELLNEVGAMPLPPYITRPVTLNDTERYQTVYARHNGAVAAPTAGLHFDEGLFQQLDRVGIERAFVTLHVGAGTFQPLRVEQVAQHQMHAEYMELSASVCDQIKKVKARGNKVIAVGSTSVRCLETAVKSGELNAFTGDTSLFIYPGFNFHVVDAIITNFHLPRSSLLMLVAAFTGFDTMMHAYSAAIDERYRFFSYGDAMLIY